MQFLEKQVVNSKDEELDLENKYLQQQRKDKEEIRKLNSKLENIKKLSGFQFQDKQDDCQLHFQEISDRCSWEIEEMETVLQQSSTNKEEGHYQPSCVEAARPGNEPEVQVCRSKKTNWQSSKKKERRKRNDEVVLSGEGKEK